MLRNGDFTDDYSTDEPWETLPPEPGTNGLRNQRPLEWQLEWLKMGTPLYDDANSIANGIPECVHKLKKQLPQDEWPGGPNALILAGDKVYKIFSASASFGVTLSQTVTGLEEGSVAKLIVPIQVHLHGGTDPWGAESGVWVNGVGGWVNGEKMKDRHWYKHELEFTVPDNGQAEIVIRVKSKHNNAKDFFIDGITLDAIIDTIGPPPLPSVKTIYIQKPVGMQIKRGVSNQTGTIEVNVPAGVEIEVV